jgi:thiamine biosynthesis lipoprotein
LVLGLLGLGALIILLYVLQPHSDEIKYIEETRLLMDTVIRVVVYDRDFPPDSVKQAIAAAFEKFVLIEHLCSSVSDSSEISQINRQAGCAPVKISPHVRRVIEYARYTSNLSTGAFDISFLPVSRCWNFYDTRQPFRKPAAAEIADALTKVDFRKIEINPDSVFLTEPGMEIDVGGIAKGYAIDLAFETLQKFGLRDFQIDAGGDLRFLAGPVSAGKRKIWLKHPRDRAKLWGYFKMDTGSVATSGDYERFFIEDSVRYHHIIDPKTGYPAQKAVSVTIIAPTALVADAFATAVFVLGPVAGLELAEAQPELDAVILYLENGELKWVASNGIREKLVIENQDVSAIN